MWTCYGYFIGGLLFTSCSAANIFALVVSVTLASAKKLLSTELSYMSEKKTLQNVILPFASKTELLRLTEEHIYGLVYKHLDNNSGNCPGTKPPVSE